MFILRNKLSSPFYFQGQLSKCALVGGNFFLGKNLRCREKDLYTINHNFRVIIFKLDTFFKIRI